MLGEAAATSVMQEGKLRHHVRAWHHTRSKRAALASLSLGDPLVNLFNNINVYKVADLASPALYWSTPRTVPTLLGSPCPPQITQHPCPVPGYSHARGVSIRMESWSFWLCIGAAARAAPAGPIHLPGLGVQSCYHINLDF